MILADALTIGGVVASAVWTVARINATMTGLAASIQHLAKAVDEQRELTAEIAEKLHRYEVELARSRNV